MSTQTDAPKLLAAPPVIPMSIVCQSCKEETGLTLESIVEMTIDAHICCPICGNMIYSCLPEKPAAYVYSSTTTSAGTTTSVYDEDDYD